jgi:LPXTG-motif cell wall-anchored protein
MDSERFAGYFMLVTAVIVAIPVGLQLRAREADWKHAWSPVLFVLGLAAIGAAYAFGAPQNQRSIAVAGVAAMLLGLLFAQKRRNSHRQG